MFPFVCSTGDLRHHKLNISSKPIKKEKRNSVFAVLHWKINEVSMWIVYCGKKILYRCTWRGVAEQEDALVFCVCTVYNIFFLSISNDFTILLSPLSTDEMWSFYLVNISDSHLQQVRNICFQWLCSSTVEVRHHYLQGGQRFHLLTSQYSSTE